MARFYHISPSLLPHRALNMVNVLKEKCLFMAGSFFHGILCLKICATQDNFPAFPPQFPALPQNSANVLWGKPVFSVSLVSNPPSSPKEPTRSFSRFSYPSEISLPGVYWPLSVNELREENIISSSQDSLIVLRLVLVAHTAIPRL